MWPSDHKQAADRQVVVGDIGGQSASVWGWEATQEGEDRCNQNAFESSIEPD